MSKHKLPLRAEKAFDKMRSDGGRIDCIHIAKELKITHGKAVRYFSLYVRKMEDTPEEVPEPKATGPLIACVIRLPDGSVGCYDKDKQLLKEYSGRDSKELQERISKASDSTTEWQLFNKDAI